MNHSSPRLIALTAALCSAVGAPTSALADDTEAAPPRRVAIVVGANAAAPGRKALRFAHRDADSMAEVLRELGSFEAGEVLVLHDPAPQTVLKALDRELRAASEATGETMLLFYYSGHADSKSLYPSGKPLRLSDLKKRLEDERASVRVGVIDACRGGGWTGAKGITESEPFDVDLEVGLASEGSALIASSSGMEDAHESSHLKGSFFTHHFTIGLRGAGDGDRDGQVTLTEAFDYAKTRTVRDTALHTAMPQNPSFEYRLRGRQDLPLSVVSAGSTRLTLTQKNGPLQLIHIDTGLVVLEMPKGKRAMTLALPPGRYLVRRRTRGALSAHEVRVRAGKTTRVSEAQLTRVGSGRLAVKGAPGETPLTPSPARRHRADDFMVSFMFIAPRYRMDVDGPFGRRTGSGHLEAYLGLVSYLRRHTPFWGTRVSVGGGRQDNLLSGEGAIHLGLGQVASVPLARNGLLEAYGTIDLGLQFEVNSDVGELPTQLIGNVALGVRIFSIYAEVGTTYNIYPRSGTYGTVTLIEPEAGLRLEAGLRFENTLF